MAEWGAAGAVFAAAYGLGKAGYDCAVLGAADRAGGCDLTVRGGDGHYMDTGPARIPQWMITLGCCELGVPLARSAT
ncbi:FAD-dependent oxidoreductase [Streptomyces rimosus]